MWHRYRSHRDLAVWFLKMILCVCAFSNEDSEKRLPKSALVLLCKYEPVLNWSRDCDNILYQSLVEVLIPDVLRPIPSESHTTHYHIYSTYSTFPPARCRCPI